MEETNKLLVAEKNVEVVPFFSQEATEILSETRNNDKTRSELLARNAELQAAPADFVTGESGILEVTAQKTSKQKVLNRILMNFF